MKKTMNKTTKNNFINYGISNRPFCDRRDTFRNRKSFKTSDGSYGSALRFTRLHQSL